MPQNTQIPAAPPPLLFATPKEAWHSVRMLCDQAGLTLAQKNIICSCIFQESRFYNRLPNGQPIKHENLNQDGSLSSTDWGICQINDYFHIGWGKDFSDVNFVLSNPGKVVEWMIGMYKKGMLGQWSSFRSGANRQWLLPNSPMWQLAQ